MLDPRSVYEYSLSLQDSWEDQELKKRLELFQTFSKLYERHRDLLNEILALEHTGSKGLGQPGLFNYIQGVVLDQQVFLTTNLLDGHSQVVTQPQQIWLIGRDGAQVSLPIRDKRLSRRHAAIQYRAGEGFSITDLGSTNGTFVNGERIGQRLVLCEGDRIRLGSMTFSFFICRTGQALPPLPPDLLAQLGSPPLPATIPGGEPASPSNAEVETLGSKPEDSQEGIPPFVFEETLRFMRQRSGHN